DYYCMLYMGGGIFVF
nr:immunoglobulin light chain junction region [Macaca mulatta]